MALTQKNCNLGFIIERGKEKDFFKKVNENRPTEDFWADCARLRENLNDNFFEEINTLMDKEE